MRTVRGLKVLAIVAALAAGCARQPTTVPISGRILLDGKPVAGATVVFFPEGEGRQASAYTDENGSFELTSFANFDGAAPGPYRVTVNKVVTDLPPVPADPEKQAELVRQLTLEKTKKVTARSVLPRVYESAKTTPLRAVVAPGGGEVVLELAASEKTP